MAGTGPSGPQQGPGAQIDSINVTPLVDIMLVLLIIVMVTANFASSQAVPLDLPEASESDSVQTIFAVTIPEDGRLLVDGEPIDRSKLESRAAQALERTPELRAVIQADGDVTHRRVMETLDVLKSAGLTRVAFAASPEQSSESGGADNENEPTRNEDE